MAESVWPLLAQRRRRSYTASPLRTAQLRPRRHATTRMGASDMDGLVEAMLKPGATLRCTIERVPGRVDQQQTIARLMRQDPQIKKALRRAQRRRAEALVVRSRGGRPWADRKRAARVARVVEGASWTMPALPSLARDAASVAQFLRIEQA